RVALDSPGRAAALVPGDELIAVDGRRVNASADLPLLLSVDRPAVFTYARRGCLATTQLCAVQGVERWCLSWEPAASSEQLFLRDRWFRFL
ncbi:MAG TPA: signal protein PDZ, partial [Synechococcus sp. UBA9887]|nr:signal protein PDZ [Synechococcus sp. UBA9887]